ncbi:MAG TPA: deoxyribonuclease IV [Phycisphaerae bacterium]|nr:deoxyribonuclease IV [Phycisphaerae bacterium]
MALFGSHLSIAGGVENALLAAEKLGMETVQIFTANQRQWASKPLDPVAVEGFRGHVRRLGFSRVVSHASYLINLAAVEQGAWENSVRAFAREMERCEALGVTDLVVHPGAHCGSGEECGVGRVIAALNVLLEADKTGTVRICLETTAGQGSCLGCRFEQLAEMIAGTKRKERLGVCVDTCHILAAGYDITTAAGMEAALAELEKTVGLERVRVWHLNDSKKPLGSRVDRHEHVGRGCVGVAAFGVICRDERFRGVPKILETPKDPAPDGRDWDVVNLELLRKLAAGEDARPKVFREKKAKTKKGAKAGTREVKGKKKGVAR